jgi:BCD family chlorophyll transporter-like MFS transporter
VLVDIARNFAPDGPAFGTVFAFEALLFLAAAMMSARVMETPQAIMPATMVPGE